MRANVIGVDFARGPRIMLNSGAWFDFLDPEASPFNIEDIAHGLAHQCRYAGQCKAFYSVAEHSLLVSEICSAAPYAALLHDAAEAFLGDITRPLKQLLPDYKKLERRVNGVIRRRFGIPEGFNEEVKAADLRVLAAEQRQIMPPATSSWVAAANIVPAEVRVQHLDPATAKRSFLRSFAELCPGERAIV